METKFNFKGDLFMKFKKEVNELLKEMANGHHDNFFGCVAVLVLGMGAILEILTLGITLLCNLCSRAALSFIKLEEWFQNKKNNSKKD